MPVQRALTRRHRLAVVSYLAVVALTAALGLAGSDILSAVRAYVAGESLWSKGQKEALFHLDRYARTQLPADHQRFEAALAVPLGDRRARLALSRARPDRDEARAGLLQGGNHPDDIASMITLFVRFQDVPFMSDAIAIWAEADAGIEELRALGQRMREQVEAGRGDGPELRALAQQLPALDARLTQLERQFSTRLGEASRTARRVIVWTLLGLTLVLATAGLAMISRLLDQQLAAERALREGHERWTLAAEAAGIGVFDWEVERDHVGFDARAATFSGRSAGPVETGSEVLSGSHVVADDRDRVAAALRQAIARAEPVVVRYRVTLPDPATTHIELRARVRAHGRTPRMIGILRDVSQEIRSERLRLDKEAAERANRAKGEFLSRVSHELRTPLNAVLGFAQLLQLDTAEPLRAVQSQRVQLIIDSGRHLLELIDDMLDVTSIDAGQLRVATDPLRLGDLLERCRERLAGPARAQGVRLVADAPFPDLHVVGDARRLDQVFTHLVSNAIKYNRPQGEVRLALARDGDEAVASVHDTGFGLTSVQLGQLFQPFNRLGAEYSKVRGSGLGLVIARQLVALMGGRVEASSRPGEGSTFAVRLPLARPDTAA